MKKFLSVLMIAALTTAALAGCGSSAEEETAENEQTEEAAVETDFTGADVYKRQDYLVSYKDIFNACTSKVLSLTEFGTGNSRCSGCYLKFCDFGAFI